MALPYAGWVILIFNVLFTVLATVAVGLRLWVRLVLLRTGYRMLLTEYCLLATLALQYLGAVVGTISSANSVDGSPALLAKLQFVLNVQTVSILSCLKLSYLSFFHEMFPSKPFRRWIYFVAVLTGIFWCVFCLPSLGYCRPIQAFWDKDIPGAHCVDASAYELAGAIMNLVIDLMIFVMPIPMIWSLHMSRRKKWTVTAMFSFGIVVIGMTTMRIYEVVHSNVWKSNGAIALSIFACLENCLGIINTCIPFLYQVITPMRRQFQKIRFVFIRIRRRTNETATYVPAYSNPSTEASSGGGHVSMVEDMDANDDDRQVIRAVTKSAGHKGLGHFEKSATPVIAEEVDLEAAAGEMQEKQPRETVTYYTV